MANHSPGTNCKPDNSNEHQQAAEHSEYKKLDRRIYSPLPSPYADYKIHRNKRCFPEHIKEKEVKRYEYTNHAYFQKKHEESKFFYFFIYAFPTGQQS